MSHLLRRECVIHGIHHVSFAIRQDKRIRAASKNQHTADRVIVPAGSANSNNGVSLVEHMTTKRTTRRRETDHPVVQGILQYFRAA